VLWRPRRRLVVRGTIETTVAVRSFKIGAIEDHEFVIASDGLGVFFIAALRNATRVVVLTGAGASAESGVPTFRDKQTGKMVRLMTVHKTRQPELHQPKVMGLKVD